MIKEKSFLGKIVTVIVDRPKSSLHPKFGYKYPINYGFIPDTLANDGEEIDAYIIGIEIPIKKYSGKVKAIIIRKNDVENKLVVTPLNYELTEAKVIKDTFFQEQFFETEIIILK